MPTRQVGGQCPPYAFHLEQCIDKWCGCATADNQQRPDKNKNHQNWQQPPFLAVLEELDELPRERSAIQTALLRKMVAPTRGRLLTVGFVVVRFIVHVFTMSGLDARSVTVSRS